MLLQEFPHQFSPNGKRNKKLETNAAEKNKKKREHD